LDNVTIFKSARDLVGAGIPDPATGSALTITNPSAETGDLTGWTLVSGSQAAADNRVTPHSGSFFFGRTGSFGEGWRLEQDITINTTTFPELDNGRNGAELEWYQSTVDADTGRCELIFKDEEGIELARLTAPTLATPNGVWTQRLLVGKIPAGTRIITVAIEAVSHIGVFADGYFDTLALQITNEVLTAVATDELQVRVYQLSGLDEIGRGRPSDLVDVVGNQ
jgi:hypothetical protein